MLFLNLFLLKHYLNENNTVESTFAFINAEGAVHCGSLGYFTTLEQAEKRIRHFANKQGYTLLNLRIEDGKFVADVKE
ncbi:hypothetical protein [Dolosigranulum pigrum]|uniref:hypothetical protein n=1 Tax=Dolosigranulum pigrum TaxID=29394 RepID=UPI000DC285A3|nr:hypothetical protein [Dolosigranulum pigrum]RAN54059.1 hypothetical protein B8A31_01935 [Dolosigranulum pigrum]